MQNFGSMQPCSIMAVWVIFAMWQSDLLNDSKYVYSDIVVDLINMHTCHVHTSTLIHVFIYIHMQTHVCLSTYIPKCIYSYMHAYTHTCLHTYIYVCLYIYKCSQVCLHIYANAHADTVACLAT